MSDWIDFLEGPGLDFSASLAKGRNLLGSQSQLIKLYGEPIPGALMIQLTGTLFGLPPGSIRRRSGDATGIYGCIGITPDLSVGFGTYNPFGGAGIYRLYYWVRGVMGLQGWGSPWNFDETSGRGFNELHALSFRPTSAGMQLDDTFPSDEYFQSYDNDRFPVGVPNPSPQSQGFRTPRAMNATVLQTNHDAVPSGAFYLDRVVEFSIRKTISGAYPFNPSFGIFITNSAQEWFGGGVGPGTYLRSEVDVGTPLVDGIGERYGSRLFMWKNTGSLNPDLILGGGKHFTSADLALVGGDLTRLNSMEVMFLGAVPDTAIKPFKVTLLKGS